MKREFSAQEKNQKSLVELDPDYQNFLLIFSLSLLVTYQPVKSQNEPDCEVCRRMIASHVLTHQ